MDFSAVCRTCLNTENLQPIFGELKNYSLDIYLTTGVKVDMKDGLPQNVCTDCTTFVINTMIFRRQCNHIQLRLMNLKNNIGTSSATPFQKEDICETNDVVNLDKIKIELDCEEYIKPLQHFDNSKLIRDSADNEKLSRTFDLSSDTQIVASLEVAEITKTQVRKKHKHQLLSCNDMELPYNEVFDSNSKQQRVSCKLCQKNLSIRSIDAHMARSHPGADPRKVKCELCDNFILKNKLNRHKSMMHGSECFRCGYCKLEFESKDFLIEHVKECTLKKKKRRTRGELGRKLIECDVCNKQMQKASLRMHKLITHAGLGPVCEHCGKRMGNKYRLNEHYRAKHGYQKFKCTYCTFQSASAMAIRNHERRHRGEKPFVCETCGSKFHAAYLLAQHKQSHRTEKQFKCDQCPAMFKANNSLHMHKYTCHSSAIYRCGVCSRAYSCRHYAVKHVRRVHKRYDQQPPVLCEPGGT